MDSEEPPWELEDVEEAHEESPDTFHIATLAERSSLRPGHLVKLIFLIPQDDEDLGEVLQGERLYVRVADRVDGRYEGVLEEGSGLTEVLGPGTKIEFGPEHVATIIDET